VSVIVFTWLLAGISCVACGVAIYYAIDARRTLKRIRSRY
jgi:hypothetical protein